MQVLTPHDHELIALLRENARETTTNLAKKLGVSRTTVQARLERLQRNRVIKGFTVQIDPALEAQQIEATVLIVVAPKGAAGVISALKQERVVRSLSTVSGVYDLMAYISAPDVATLDQVLDKIGDLEGVTRTTSMVMLAKKIDR